MKQLIRSRVLPILCAALFAAACGEDEPTSPDTNGLHSPSMPGEVPGELSTTFDVEWGENTILIDSTDVLAMKVDTVEHRYYLPSGSAASDAEPGDIVVFHGYTIRKVISASESGDQVVLETEDATITEAIKNGVVDWTFKPDFDKTPPPTIIQDGKEVSWNKAAWNPPFTLKLKLADHDWTLTLGCENEDSIYASVAIARGNTEYKLTGGLSEFRNKGRFEIVDHELKSFQYVGRDLRGSIKTEMDVHWDGIVVDKEIPVTLFTYRFLVGPLLMKLEFPLVFAAFVQLPIGGRVHVGTQYNFDVDVGFTVDPSTGSASPIFDARYTGFENDSIKVNPNGAGTAEYAIAFPRMQWSIMELPAYYYIHLAYLMNGNYSQNDMAHNTCITGKRVLAAVGGFELKIFDIFKASDFVQLYYQEDEFYRSPGCP